MKRKKLFFSIIIYLVISAVLFGLPVITSADSFTEEVDKNDTLSDTTSTSKSITLDTENVYVGIKPASYETSYIDQICSGEYMVCGKIDDGKLYIPFMASNFNTSRHPVTQTTAVDNSLSLVLREADFWMLGGNAKTVEKAVFSYVPLEVSSVSVYKYTLKFIPKNGETYIGYLAYNINGINYYLCIDRDDGNKVKVTKDSKTEWVLYFDYKKDSVEYNAGLYSLGVRANKKCDGKETYLTIDENGFKVTHDEADLLYFIDTVDESESDQKYVLVQDGEKKTLVSAHSTASLEECINSETEDSFYKWVVGTEDCSYYTFQEKNSQMNETLYKTSGIDKEEFTGETVKYSYTSENISKNDGAAEATYLVREFKKNETAIVTALHGYKVFYSANGNPFFDDSVISVTYGKMKNSVYDDSFQSFTNGETRVCEGNWIALTLPTVQESGYVWKFSSVYVGNHSTGENLGTECYSLENDGRTILIKSMPSCDISVSFSYSQTAVQSLDKNTGLYHTYFKLNSGQYSGYYTVPDSGNAVTVNADSNVTLVLSTDTELDQFIKAVDAQKYDASTDDENYDFEVQWYYQKDNVVHKIMSFSSNDLDWSYYRVSSAGAADQYAIEADWSEHHFDEDDVTVTVWAVLKKTLKNTSVSVTYETEKYSLRFVERINDTEESGITVRGVDTSTPRFTDTVYIYSKDYKSGNYDNGWGMDKVSACYVSYDGSACGHAKESFKNYILTLNEDCRDDNINTMTGQTADNGTKYNYRNYSYVVTKNGTYTFMLVNKDGSTRYYYVTYNNIIESDKGIEDNFSVLDVNTDDVKEADLVILKPNNNYYIPDAGRVYATATNAHGTEVYEGTLCLNTETQSDDTQTVYDGVYWKFNIENPGNYTIVMEDYYGRTNTKLEFSVGNYNNLFADYTMSYYESNGDGTHTRYDVDSNGVVTTTENCSGGTADCCHKAICSVCGKEYGEYASDNHTDLKKIEYTAPSSTFENLNTVYTPGCFEHWYCSGCGKRFADENCETEVDFSDVRIDVNSTYCSNGDGTHYYYAYQSLDTIVKKTENCTGGVASCNNRAHCEKCGGQYGELSSKNHYGLEYCEKLDPTEEADGHESYYYCEDCGCYFEDEEASIKIENPEVINRLAGSSLLTIKIPAACEYDGTEKKAVVSVNEGVTGIGKISIHYFDENDEELDGAPVNPGRYIVKLDIEEGEKFTGRTGITSDKWVIEIRKKSIENMTAKLDEDCYVRTGNEITPECSLKNGESVLIKGQDYTCEYQDNVEAGTAKLIFTGAVNYTGEKTVSFTIKSIEDLAEKRNFENLTEGEKAQPSITFGEGTGLCAEDVAEVFADDVKIGQDQYTVTDGCAVLTLDESFVEKLAAGKHKLKVVFGEEYTGIVYETEFVIAEKADSPEKDDENDTEEKTDDGNEKTDTGEDKDESVDKKEDTEEKEEKIPYTGDNSKCGIWNGISVMSAISLGAVLTIKKKKT